jgi:hypothetical protein
MNCAVARNHLGRQFQQWSKLSDSTLRRIWRKASLNQAVGGDVRRFERVECFHGGGGLALIGAAATETGIPLALAETALRVGQETAANQGQSSVPTEPNGRDDSGRFTAEFNRAVRGPAEPGQTDSRWLTDGAKRKRRNLAGLQLLSLSADVVSQRMLAMGVVGLLSERRGFDGLDGHRGALLGVLGGTAYRPATLDKTLAELALLNVGIELWHTHAEHWALRVQQWCKGETPPRWIVFYLDTSQEPYWTERYALSGLVSRVGRVMPCLSRVALTAGPGVPLLVETSAGSRSLTDALRSAIEQTESFVGPGELRRFTVFDAAGSSAGMLAQITSLPGHRVITVIKGPRLKNLVLEDPGEWEAYGEKAKIRSGWVTLRGEDAPAEGVRLRAVERERPGSRHPQRTIFVTEAPPKELSAREVVDIYLSRWPHQEQVFRDTRNGIGLDRTHGFTGEYVTHVALETNLEKAEGRVKRAKATVEKTQVVQSDVEGLAKCAPADHNETAQTALLRAKKEHKAAKKALVEANEDLESLRTMPRVIFQRDTTRENIFTVLALTAMMLIEFVMKEYFGGLKMEFRTFIEHFVDAPTTIRTNRHRILYQIECNPRNPERTAQLRQACLEVTRRRLKKHGRRLVFEVVNPAGQSP